MSPVEGRRDAMKYGISLQSKGPASQPEAQIANIQRAESLGYEYALLGDHIVIPKKIEAEYPYSATGQFTSAATGEAFEQITALAFLAGATKKIRLVTSVMIVPHRHPLLAAKSIATLDYLSKGRVTVGMGAGWLREEFELLDLPPFEERGAVTNEYIRAMKELWTSPSPKFDGKYVKFSNIFFEPKPVQKPHPPLWIGGESPAALRRAAVLGDAWHPIGSNPKFPLTTPEQVKASADRLYSEVKKAGRKKSEVEISYRVPRSRVSKERMGAFTGSPAQIVEDIKAFAMVGVGHIILDFRSDDVKETIRWTEEFADKVLPKMGSV
jgi:probable F420-dependent oxidoreductase